MATIDNASYIIAGFPPETNCYDQSLKVSANGLSSTCHQDLDTLSPNNSQVVDPNMVFSQEDKDGNINDFLSLLDLQMKPGGPSKTDVGDVPYDQANDIGDQLDKEPG